MPLAGSSGIRLRGSDSVSHFANLTPIKSDPLKGWLGIARIGVLIGEVLLSVVFQGAAPYIIVAGSAIQQGLDTYTFAKHKKTIKSGISFGLTSLINIVPAAWAFRGVATASKSVVKIADATEKKGFKYLVKGLDPDFNNAYKAVNTGSKFAGKTVGKVNLHQQKLLINRGVLPRYAKTQKKLEFETALQYSFRPQGPKGQDIFNNKDLAIIRRTLREFAKGQTTMEQVLRRFRRRNMLSIFAREAIAKTGPKKMTRGIERLSQVYLTEQALAAANTITKTTRFRRLKKLYRWFGTSSQGGLKQRVKTGRFWTQTAQLANPNDFAREILNKPTGWLLRGYKKTDNAGKVIWEWKGLRQHARSLGKTVEAKMPSITKILKSPFKAKLFLKYDRIKTRLAKIGTLTLDHTFLMGWQTLSANEAYSEVIFYFNPITTSPSTPGSLNYGGKKSFPYTIRTAHLEALKNDPHPGNMYLKGRSGFSPIAMNPGGRRGLTFSIMNEALTLLSLDIKITPLRNVLSVISNFKQVVKDVIQGTYTKKWTSTFVNTLRRLWLNKVTRIVGHTLGNIISAEVGSHIGRLLKTVGQGFQRVKSKTRYVNGHKVVDRKTVFSSSYNWKPLVKRGIPLTGKSIGIRRTPKMNPVRRNIRRRTYGRNIRRVPGLFIK